MPKISVVIPAYNVERFLSECLDSLQVQSLLDFEVLICDDGSNDNTEEVASNYIKSDSRFSYYKLKHTGAGGARNFGIDRATGDFLYFLDADDMITSDALQILYSAAVEHQADIVIGRSHYLDDITGEETPIDFTTINVTFNTPLIGKNLPERPFQSFVGWPWDKLFRSDFIKQKHLRFQTLRSTNDAYFVFMALCKAKCITCVDRDIFTHRTNNAGSLEHTRSKSWNNAILAMDSIRLEFSEDPSIGEYWESFVNWTSHFSYWSMASLKEEDLSIEVIEAFNNFLADINVDNANFYSRENADFLMLSRSNRSEVIRDYIILRKHNESLVNRLYAEEHELINEIDRLSLLLKEKDNLLAESTGRLASIEGSKSYKVSKVILKPVQLLRTIVNNKL